MINVDNDNHDDLSRRALTIAHMLILEKAPRDAQIVFVALNERGTP